MASIKEVGKLQWKVQIRRKGYPNQYGTFSTKKDAQAWARQIETEMDRGVFVSRSEAERTTLSEIIQRYREEMLPKMRGKHLSPALNAIEPVLGAYSLAALSSKHIKNYIDKRLKSVSTETVRKEFSVLSILIDLAIKKWGMSLPTNPCAMVIRPNPGKARDRRPQTRELEALLSVCEPRLSLLIRFAIETGARLGELLSVEWSDIHEEEKRMVIRGIDGQGTKNGDATRDAPVFKEARAILGEIRLLPPSSDRRVFYWWRRSDSLTKSWARAITRAQIEYLKQQGKEALIPRSDIIGEGDAVRGDRAKSRQQVNQANKRAAALRIAVDQLTDGFLSNLRFHDLRREAASRWLEQGKTPLEVSRYLGHKSPSITLKVYENLSIRESLQKYD